MTSLFSRLQKLNKELRPNWSVDWNGPLHVLASDGSGIHQAKARDAKTAEAIVGCRNSLPAVLNLIEAARLVTEETWFRVRSEGTAYDLSQAVAVFVSGQEEQP